VSESNQPTGLLPPEAALYLQGAQDESLQFGFLIGDWDVDVTRYKPDGAVQIQHKAKWNAKYLNEKRMVIDDFKACLPDGRDLSSIVTLRTYSKATQRWELTFLAALMPALPSEFNGVFRDGEMHLQATGKGPGGQPFNSRIRFFDIEKSAFQWEQSVSQDGGANWLRISSMSARRAAMPG